ncbi:AraC family transcriptional regulator [Paenibacillus sp. OV219]|uniref:AraC family transcriptional regulator n=1 Tax=Paenibacillus sp. OV219 TaxID=1884377 RepID=UPI0008B95561|nr:AraC family transcriptional regulator [Paenibacillus sp. OV219]SEO13403.1 AraC-like ligand binding domain-containing protein [Paenibacillus sp. OV219]
MKLRKHGYLDAIGGIGNRAGGIHPYCELLCITEGEAELVWSGVSYPVTGTAMFILLPNTPHQLIQRSDRLSYWFVEFLAEDEDRLPAIEGIYRWNRQQCELDWASSPYAAMRSAFEATRMLIRTEAALPEELFKEALLTDLRKLLLLMGSNRIVDPKQAHAAYPASEMLVTEVLRFLESVFPQPITLQTLADYTHYNPSYLIRLFRQQTGKTPFAYLNELRLQAASQYLLHSTMSVQQISSACGYQSIHYFSRLFKRSFSVAPSEYRKQAINEPTQ